MSLYIKSSNLAHLGPLIPLTQYNTNVSPYVLQLKAICVKSRKAAFVHLMCMSLYINSSNLAHFAHLLTNTTQNTKVPAKVLQVSKQRLLGFVLTTILLTILMFKIQCNIYARIFHMYPSVSIQRTCTKMHVRRDPKYSRTWELGTPKGL